VTDRSKKETARDDFERQLRKMNEALMVSSVNQHELTEQAEQSEAALRASENRFRAFITASSDVMYRMSPDWSEMRQLDGRNFIVDTAKPSGDWLQEYIHPDDQPQVRAAIHEAIRTKSLFELEHRVWRVDGTMGWTFSHAVPLLDAKGEIVEWIGTARDVTEAWQIREALSESEERFSKAFASSPMILTISSLETGKLIEVNETFVEATGFSREEAIGKTTVELGVWKKLDDREKQLDKVRQKGRTRNLEYTFRKRNGEEIIGLVSAELIEIRGEKFALTTIQDITERKRAEEALVAAERRAADEYHALLSRIVPLGQILGTARELDSIYRTVNEFVADSMPCSAFFVSFYDAETNMRHAAYASGLGGEIDISTLPPIKLTEDGGPNSQAVFGRKPVVASQYMELMKNRPYVIVEDDGINPNSSLVIPMVVMDRVIGTIEVQAYEKNAFREEHITSLGMVANLAAVAIENVRLIEVEAKAREAAERANRAKDEFLSILSHELRTPLNSMLGWTRMLRMGALDKEQAEKALEVIDRNTRQQSSLIEDLLDVSRIISGQMRIEKETLDLVSLIRESSEALKPSASAKNVSLVFSSDEASLPADGDPVRLQQVITNLLQNAIKFTPENGRIVVSLRKTDIMAEISVEDSGIGIEEEFLPFIFDRFRQADASAKRSFTGLGLGLTIVKNIVELHGGSIKVDSGGKDKGAGFTITIPLAGEFYAGETSLNGTKGNSTSGSSLTGAKILLVDDDAESLMPIKIFLEREDAEVVSAESGRKALKELSGRDFDLIISDIGMPEMDGFQFLSKLRNSKKSRNIAIPAIALTAYASAEHRQLALASGFQQHLAKPVDFDALLDEVRKIFDGKAIELAERVRTSSGSDRVS